MRKSLDELWKTPTPDMLEIRQEGIGTLRPIQQPGEEKIGGKRGYRMQMQITIEIPFLVYYSFFRSRHDPFVNFRFSTTDTSLWLLTRPQRNFSLVIGICTDPINLAHVAHALQQ